MRYVLRAGRLVNVDTGEPLHTDNRYTLSAAPYVLSDTPGYRSPIDGKWIEGRRARKYDLESNGCVERDPPARKRGYRNKRFAEKHGLPFEG